MKELHATNEKMAGKLVCRPEAVQVAPPDMLASFSRTFVLSLLLTHEQLKLPKACSEAWG